MRYATFREDGRLQARYNDAFNVIPDGAIPLSDDIVELMGQMTEGYWELIDGVVMYTVPPRPQLPINPVPAFVTMRQARLALLQTDRLSQVTVLIDAMPNVEQARIEWEFSSTVQRDHPLVAYIATNLPLTEAEVDELFILADTL